MAKTDQTQAFGGQHFKVAQHIQVTGGDGQYLSLTDTYLDLLIHSASFSSYSMPHHGSASWTNN